MSYFQAIMLAYGITGVVRVLLHVPVLKSEWVEYDNMMEENLSMLEKQQLTSGTYNFTKYIVFGIAIVLTWATWPTMSFKNKEVKDD